MWFWALELLFLWGHKAETIKLSSIKKQKPSVWRRLFKTPLDIHVSTSFRSWWGVKGAQQNLCNPTTALVEGMGRKSGKKHVRDEKLGQSLVRWRQTGFDWAQEVSWRNEQHEKNLCMHGIYHNSKYVRFRGQGVKASPTWLVPVYLLRCYDHRIMLASQLNTWQPVCLSTNLAVLTQMSISLFLYAQHQLKCFCPFR